MKKNAQCESAPQCDSTSQGNQHLSVNQHLNVNQFLEVKTLKCVISIFAKCLPTNRESEESEAVVIV